MRTSLRTPRNTRLALVFLLLAMMAGAGTVRGAVDRKDSFTIGANKLAVTAFSGQDEHARSHKPGDCSDLIGSFLDPACQGDPRKRHAGRATHRVATAVFSNTGSGEPE